jgi:hypothetical protein
VKIHTVRFRSMAYGHARVTGIDVQAASKAATKYWIGFAARKISRAPGGVGARLRIT